MVVVGFAGEGEGPDGDAGRDLAGGSGGAGVEDDGWGGVVGVVGVVGGGGVVGEVGAGGGDVADDGGSFVGFAGGVGVDDAGPEAGTRGARGDVECRGAFVDFCAVLDALFDEAGCAGAGGDEFEFVWGGLVSGAVG